MKRARRLHDLISFSRSAKAGFTLIDLLIACVVLVILAAIAYPSYASHVRKAHRAEAKVILLETAQYMERYHATHNTYADARIDAVSAVSPKGAEASRARYLIRFVGVPDAMTFTVQAAPTNGQEADDCGVLTVDQLGARTASVRGVGNPSSTTNASTHHASFQTTFSDTIVFRVSALVFFLARAHVQKYHE